MKPLELRRLYDRDIPNANLYFMKGEMMAAVKPQIQHQPRPVKLGELVLVAVENRDLLSLVVKVNSNQTVNLRIFDDGSVNAWFAKEVKYGTEPGEWRFA